MTASMINVGGNAPVTTPESISRSRRLADALVAQGMQENPNMRHWTQALGKVLQTGVGALRNDFANADERDAKSDAIKGLATALAGGGFDQAMANPYSQGQAIDMQVADRNRAQSNSEWDRRNAINTQNQQNMFQLRQDAQRNDPGYQLGLDHKRAQIEDMKRKAQPDPVENFLLQRLQGVGGPQQPQGGFQKQSFEGGQGGAQFIPTAGAAGQSQSQPNMVDTPFGQMSVEEARKMAGTMLLSPKYKAAGRAILDSIPSDQGGLGRLAQNQLEERTLNAASALGRLDNIEKQFNPAFLEIPKRMEMLGLSWSAKLGNQIGGKLSKDQVGQLRNFAAFRSTTLNNLNTILKELSGAAVTPQEFTRIQNEQPTAGTGIFDGDDPVSFLAKLKQTKQTLRSAIARYNFMRSQGLNFDKNRLDQFMSLEDVPAAIENRGAQIEQQLRQQNPNVPQNMLDSQVRQQIKQEFGI